MLTCASAALCTIMYNARRLERAAPSASERALPHGAVATRDANHPILSGARRVVREIFAGLGRAVVALGTDAFGKTAGKRVFSRCRRVLASYSGEYPVQSIAILPITRSLATATAAAFRGRGARLARFAECIQPVLWSGARHQTRASRSVPCPRASPRPCGDRRASRWSPCTVPLVGLRNCVDADRAAARAA